MLSFYSIHSPFTDPSPWSHLLKELPSDIPGLCEAIQGLVVHYRASGIEKQFQNPALKVPGEVMCYSPTGNIRPVEVAA